MGGYNDGELLTLITLSKEISRSCFIRDLLQGKRSGSDMLDAAAR